MAREKLSGEISSGSRLRENVSKIFDCFLISSRLSDHESDLKPDYKFPHDFHDEEILQQSLLFCFPFDYNALTLSSIKNHCYQFTFILTDIEGKHRFGMCKLVDEGTKCYCILSFMPWYDIFHAILSCANDLASQPSELETVLANLYHQQVPNPSETIHVNPVLKFQVPDPNSLPSIPENKNISDYHAKVNRGFMMEVFASLMFERRIIFTSDNLSILSCCIHGAEALLKPLHWQHIFIPAMPAHLLDYCLAPMPYLVGIHASLMTKVRGMIAMDDDIIVANIDRQEIETIHSDLEHIPNDIVSFLKSLLKKPTVGIGRNLSIAFLRTQARLIGGYRNGLTFKPGEEIIFDEDKFIEFYKSNTEKEFARALVQLQTFKQFVEGRLDMLNTGVGFRDDFENEVNVADAASADKDSYKEWLASAKKGGNQLITQFKRKAKVNMRVAKENIRDVIKQQQQAAIKKKNLDENIQPTRPAKPVRPPPINPDKLAELKTQRPKPPRPPPPQPVGSSSKFFEKVHARHTRRYKTLDLSDEETPLKAEDHTVKEPKPALADTNKGADINLLGDWQSNTFGTTNTISPTHPSDATSFQSDFFRFPYNDNPATDQNVEEQSNEAVSQPWAETDLSSSKDHSRGSPKLANTATPNHLHRVLTPSHKHITPATTSLLDFSATSTAEVEGLDGGQSAVSTSLASDDLLGLDLFGKNNSSAPASSSSIGTWKPFNNQDSVFANVFHTPHSAPVLTPTTKNDVVQSPSIRKPDISTSNNPFYSSSSATGQQGARSMNSKPSYFNELQGSGNDPYASGTLNASLQPHGSNPYTGSVQSTSPYMQRNVNFPNNYSQTSNNSQISSGNRQTLPVKRGNIALNNSNVTTSLANSAPSRSYPVKSQANGKDLFSDLLESWKSTEGK